jgi:hypothetical protein
MEHDKHFVHDLKVMRGIVNRNGFRGFNQTFEFRCDPQNTENKCLVSVTIPSSEFSKGEVKLKLGKRKCRTCTAQCFANKLSIPIKVEKDTTVV